METFIDDKYFNETIYRYKEDNLTTNIINAMIKDDNDFLDKNMHLFLDSRKKNFFTWYNKYYEKIKNNKYFKFYCEIYQDLDHEDKYYDEYVEESSKYIIENKIVSEYLFLSGHVSKNKQKYYLNKYTYFTKLYSELYYLTKYNNKHKKRYYRKKYLNEKFIYRYIIENNFNKNNIKYFINLILNTIKYIV